MAGLTRLAISQLLEQWVRTGITVTLHDANPGQNGAARIPDARFDLQPGAITLRGGSLILAEHLGELRVFEETTVTHLGIWTPGMKQFLASSLVRKPQALRSVGFVGLRVGTVLFSIAEER